MARQIQKPVLPGQMTWKSMAIMTMLLVHMGCGPAEDPIGEDVSHFLNGKAAMDRGDTEVALQEFNKSIELNPDAWAFYYRAKLHADKKDNEKAAADCKAGLKLDPNHAELKWLQVELKKSPEQRFKGRNASVPKSAK